MMKKQGKQIYYRELVVMQSNGIRVVHKMIDAQVLMTSWVLSYVVRRVYWIVN